jgi:hypothetical protein
MADDQQDNSDLLQYLKDNPDVHQKIINQKLQGSMPDEKSQDSSIFDQQAQNPAVQQDYKQASLDSDPKEMLKKQMMAPPDATTQNMMEGMASGTTGPLTGVVKRGVGTGIKLAEEAAPSFGKVVQKLPGENMAQAYARVKGLIGK